MKVFEAATQNPATLAGKFVYCTVCDGATVFKSTLLCDVTFRTEQEAHEATLAELNKEQGANMKRVGDFWMDPESGNAFSVYKFTAAEAERANNTLENCYLCVDCTFCTNCIDCSSCADCSDCERCIDCSSCANCEYCHDARNLENTANACGND